MGSIKGNGTIELGDSTLVVGANNRRAIFDGIIKDGHATEGFGGSLVKSGDDGLTLAHANNYTRFTVVMSGVLKVAKHKGSATCNGPVHVAGGTLGGPARTTRRADLISNVLPFGRLPIVQNPLRCGLAQFKLSAYFL